MSAPRLDERRPLVLSVESALVRFARHLEGLNASKNTIAAYSRDIASLNAHVREHAPAVAGDVKTITVEHLRAWLEALTLSHAPSSVARAQFATRTWTRWLLAQGLIEDDPSEKLARPKHIKPNVRVLSVAEAAKLVEAPTTVGPSKRSGNRPPARMAFVRVRDRALLELLYGSGLRVSEAVGLDLLHLDFTRREALVTGKGSRERLVPLGRMCVEALGLWIVQRRDVEHLRGYDAEAVFLSHVGSRLSVRNVQRRVKDWGVQSSGDASFHPHLLRHACATHMLEGGADHKSIQVLLGHATPATTTTYTHVSQEFVEETYERAHPLAKRKEPK